MYYFQTQLCFFVLFRLTLFEFALLCLALLPFFCHVSQPSSGSIINMVSSLECDYCSIGQKPFVVSVRTGERDIGYRESMRAALK